VPSVISCLTVTRRTRLECLRLAVDDFCAQTYPDKELILVVDDDDYASEVTALVQTRKAPIYLVAVEGHHPLGVLRNIAIDHANGDFICQWDDDDRYSPQRLAIQFAALRGARCDACFLYQQLHFFRDSRELFWTDWRYSEGRPVSAPLSRIIPGTVLCRTGATRYPEYGSLARLGEDSLFAKQLLRSACGIESPPGTYVRVYDGGNSWDREHHRLIAIGRSQLAKTILASREDIEHTLLRLNINGPVKVMAGTRTVFITAADSPSSQSVLR
jgi:glycosyltransferase involved in cell wall biosynthesis